MELWLSILYGVATRNENGDPMAPPQPETFIFLMGQPDPGHHGRLMSYGLAVGALGPTDLSNMGPKGDEVQAET